MPAATCMPEPTACWTEPTSWPATERAARGGASTSSTPKSASSSRATMSVARRRERIAAAMPRRRSSSSRPPMPRTPITTTAPGRSWRSATAASRSTAAANGPGPQSPVTRSRPSPGRAGSSSCRRVGIRVLNGTLACGRNRPSADPPAPAPSSATPGSRACLDTDRHGPAHRRSNPTIVRCWLRFRVCTLIAPCLARRDSRRSIAVSTTRRCRSRASGGGWAGRRPSSRCSPARLLFVLLHSGLGWPASWARCSARSPASSIFRGLVDVARAPAYPGAVALRRRGRAQGGRRRLAAPALVLAQEVPPALVGCSSSPGICDRRRDDLQRRSPVATAR